jgi:hypothetical protein
MTPKLPADELGKWLRKLDRATAAHEKTRATLDGLVADARDAGVPLMRIAGHTPYSREWARKIADRIEAERAARAAELEATHNSEVDADQEPPTEPPAAEE